MKSSGPDVTGNRLHDNLTLWLAYKEAKAMIQFEAASQPTEQDQKR